MTRRPLRGHLWPKCLTRMSLVMVYKEARPRVFRVCVRSTCREHQYQTGCRWNSYRFYYLSPREGPPLTLLVSPCSGPISWTVSYVEPPDNDQEAEGIKCTWNCLPPPPPLKSDPRNPRYLFIHRSSRHYEILLYLILFITLFPLVHLFLFEISRSIHLSLIAQA